MHFIYLHLQIPIPNNIFSCFSYTHNLYSFIPLFIMNVCLYLIYADLNNFFSPKNCEIVFVFCLLAVFSDGVIKEKSRIWIHEF